MMTLICVCVLSCFTQVQLSETLWTVTHQSPLYLRLIEGKSVIQVFGVDIRDRIWTLVVWLQVTALTSAVNIELCDCSQKLWIDS